MNKNASLQFLSVDGIEIAVRYRQGNKMPGLVWLGGYRSDMMGFKAVAVDALAARLGIAALRHDYSGHGASQGDFSKGTISLWLRQSLSIFKHFTRGPQILIGSSMGGWIALRMAEELKKCHIGLAGMVLIAPAPDFTNRLLEVKQRQSQRRKLDAKDSFEIRSEYKTLSYTQALIEDGENNLVMEGLIDPGCPVHILQGMQDDIVPYEHTLKLMEYLPLGDVTLTFVKDGDHRLSRSQDIDLLERIIQFFLTAA
ncbi:MAG: Abhydrolase [Candidatus Tokpelaia sp. JSC188]|nr:MAG: Abhydrolase [Candidatus Tokpelaia sp. JSC188]